MKSIINFIKKTIVFLIVFQILLYSNTDINLKLDTQSHTSMVRDIIVTKNKNIITTSDDKTIRVWDTKTGLEIRKFLGQIGTGTRGKTYSLALSKNEKYLAAGGLFTGNKLNESAIRIYNYKTGKLFKLLKSHTNTIQDLSFSKDDKYLISCGHDGKSNIWNVSNNFKLVDTIYSKSSIIQNKIVKIKDRYYAIITGFDKKVSIYDMRNKQITKSYLLNFKATYLAVSNTNLAVAGEGNQIHIFDFNLNRVKTISRKTVPWGLKYNKKGNKLIAGFGDNNHGIDVYDVKQNYKLITTLKKQLTYTMAIDFLDNNTIVSAGGDNFNILIWDISSNKYKQKIEGQGSKIWNVGIKDNLLAFGTEWSSSRGKGLLSKIINLNNFNIESIQKNSKIKFKRISSMNGYHTLTMKKNSNILNIQYYGKTIGKIKKDIQDGFNHKAYGWYKDYIVSAGENGKLKVYDKTGKKVSSLIGHTGQILSLAIYKNKLISGSDDQTIKIWDLSKIVTANKIYPILNLFITKDNEYIAYTNEGFFDASKNGAKYIGYHINQGVNKEAEYVTVDALYKTFYRPDLIQKALKGESLKKYAKNINIDKLLQDGLAPEVHILTKTTNTKNQDMDLKIQVCPKNKGGYDNLTLTINDTPISVIDTSRALKLKRKSKREDCFIYNQTISLLGGKNTIGFKATNKAGNVESKPDFLEVTFDDTNLKRKLRNKLSKISGNQNINNLHILAIAVNEYKDIELQLKYSINDATQMLKTIKKVAKPLFNKIYTYKLFDKDVTKQNIKNIFRTIKSTREDVFLLYIAGHGITDEYNGNYYYIPYDFVNKANKKAVQDQGIGQRDLMLGLSNITALKSLVLLDTCNSGSFVEANMQKTTTNRLAKATGRATISASSKSQVALEGYKGHGVFTYTLLEALKGKGYKNDSKITINELSDYVEDILPNRTNDKWGYRQTPQSSMYGVDFNIGEK